MIRRLAPSSIRQEPPGVRASRWAAPIEASLRASQRWRRHWEGLTAFFKYPVEFRRLIYTTNAIESLHSQMRKNIASRKMFPNDDAVIKILFLNLRKFSNRWSRRQGWDTVMNQLGVMFGDRLKPEVVDGM
jgi:putative transposase